MDEMCTHVCEYEGGGKGACLAACTVDAPVLMNAHTPSPPLHLHMHNSAASPRRRLPHQGRNRPRAGERLGGGGRPLWGAVQRGTWVSPLTHRHLARTRRGSISPLSNLNNTSTSIHIHTRTQTHTCLPTYLPTYIHITYLPVCIHTTGAVCLGPGGGGHRGADARGQVCAFLRLCVYVLYVWGKSGRGQGV